MPMQMIFDGAATGSGRTKFRGMAAVKRVSDTEICFRYENETMRITEKWCIDSLHQNDIKVDFILHSKKTGYYSLAT